MITPNNNDSLDAGNGPTEDMITAGIRALCIARQLLGDELSDETLVTTVLKAAIAAAPARTAAQWPTRPYYHLDRTRIGFSNSPRVQHVGGAA